MIAGQPFGGGDPDISGTTLFALGDSRINGVGTFDWRTGPIITRYAGRGRHRPDIRTTCVDEVYERGFWLTASGNVNFQLVDRFADPLDVIDLFEGEQEIPGALAYDIRANLGSEPASARRFIVLEEIRNAS